MRRTPFLCAIALSLWSVMACGSQTANAGLPPALRTHVQDERFQVVTSIRGLPLGVREKLQAMFGNGLDIAEPGAEFQGAASAADPKLLPSRRLIAAGCSLDHCLVYYERGGAALTWHLALFHWTPSETTLAAGGAAPRGLATVEDLLQTILSGTVKGQPETAW
jgi:hypothetical protein